MLLGEHSSPKPPYGYYRRVGARRAPTLDRYRSIFTTPTFGWVRITGVNSFAPQVEDRGAKEEGPKVESISAVRPLYYEVTPLGVTELHVRMCIQWKGARRRP